MAGDLIQRIRGLAERARDSTNRIRHLDALHDMRAELPPDTVLCILAVVEAAEDMAQHSFACVGDWRERERRLLEALADLKGEVGT